MAENAAEHDSLDKVATTQLKKTQQKKKLGAFSTAFGFLTRVRDTSSYRKFHPNAMKNGRGAS